MSAQRRRIISTSIRARTGKTRDSFRARRDLKVRQVPRENLVLREIPGTLVLRDPREIPESKARLDLRGRKAQKVRMAR